MIKCCVFDLDGTIADTLETIAYYGNFTLEHFGMRSIPTEKYRYLVGDGYLTLIRRMLYEIGATEDEFDNTLKVLDSTYSLSF